MGIINFALSLAWKILVTMFAFSVFISLIKNGRGTIHKLIEVCAQIITYITDKLQDWLFRKHMEHVVNSENQSEP